MKELFEIAGGSVAGRDHRDALKNCHDAYHFEVHPDIVAAVVCDGCGSGEHSEVGAKLGARILVRQVLRWFHDSPESGAAGIERSLVRIRRSVLAQIQLLADQMSGGFTATVEQYFLFTVIGLVMTRDHAFVFRCGDGLVHVNDTALTLTSADNKPDYLSYGLVEGSISQGSAFSVVSTEKTAAIRSVLIGTDGACALAAAQDRKIAGREEKVGPISQFWREDAHFKNPFSIRRRLNVINRDSRRIDYERKTAHEEHGPLLDDTTVVAVRRRK